MTTKHQPATPLRMRTARALDLSLKDAAEKRGIKTDLYRDALASWLDGQKKLKASTVRILCRYLEN